MTSAAVESAEMIAAAVCRRAAVIGTFDPSRLLAEVAPGKRDEAVEDRILSALSASIEEVVVGKDVLWRLQPEARRQALEELVARDELERTIALAKPQGRDRFGQILQATLKRGPAGNGVAMQKMSTDDLMLQALALDFARSLPPRETGVTQQPAMDPRILLARQAERRRQDYVAPAKLFGRDRDAEALDSYVADGSVIWPLIRLDASAGEQQRLRPLLLTGIGGSGKSALVVDLMRRTQRQDWSGPIIVCLDFDQKNVALGGEREWLNELTRQIGFARPTLDPALSRVRSEARQHLHRLTQQRQDVDRLTGTDNLLVVSTMREELQKAVSSGALAAETLVLVVDTFEEVLVRSNMSAETISQEPFGLVLAFIDSLSKLALPNGSAIFRAVRAVVAGRAHPFPDQEALTARWFEARLEVGELDVAAAVEFLRARSNRRVFTKARAQRIVETLPRFPLILILLAAFARDREASEIDQVVGAAQGAGVLGAAASTRVLYSRFLDRLKDHTIRDAKGERVVPRGDLVRLAHPGLALSVVTPDLIRHVLAAPTGLGEIDDQRAGDLFAALSREVWLVERVGANAVRHIPVLRRIMLPMLNGDLTPTENANIAMLETVRAVHRAAAEWYRSAGASDPGAVALAAYHDAFLGEVGMLASDQSLVRRVLDIAGDDVSAMPIEARAILRREAGSDEALSVAEAASFPVEQRSKVDAARRARRTKRGTTSRQAILDEVEQDDEIRFEAILGRDFKVSPIGLARDQLEVLQDRETAQRTESSFAEADFDEVLRNGAPSVAALRDNPQEDPPFDKLGDTTSHWTWKWALSCLAMGAADEALLKWAVATPQPVNALSTSPPFRVGTVISLAVATVALGRAPSYVSEPPYRDAVMTYPVLEGAPMYSLLSLRLRALARYWDAGRSTAMLQPFEVRPDLLQLVALWSQVRDANGGSPIATAQIPESLRRQLSAFESNPPLSSDLRMLDECEGNVLFSAVDSNSWSSQAQVPITAQRAAGLLLRGRSPELYDPIRAALGDVAAADPSNFAAAIGEIAQLAPFWPTDLLPHLFLESSVSLREADYLLARLVAFLDHAGLISQLFAALERRTKTGRRCRSVAKLVQAYDALLLAPYDAVSVLPNLRLAKDPFSGSAM
ncbi:hypothetical protein [Mesorhizobium sp. M1378]|uniref:hypothetical protein n=1 Tax=Mesorhizobium sp. M1378 TaxID=2957092 RepID=UPI0033376EBB